MHEKTIVRGQKEYFQRRFSRPKDSIIGRINLVKEQVSELEGNTAKKVYYDRTGVWLNEDFALTLFLKNEKKDTEIKEREDAKHYVNVIFGLYQCVSPDQVMMALVIDVLENL